MCVCVIHVCVPPPSSGVREIVLSSPVEPATFSNKIQKVLLKESISILPRRQLGERALIKLFSRSSWTHITSPELKSLCAFVDAYIESPVTSHIDTTMLFFTCQMLPDTEG